MLEKNIILIKLFDFQYNMRLKIIILKRIVSSSALCLTFIILLSCSNIEEEALGDDDITQKRIESTLMQMKSLGDAQGKIVKFNMEHLYENSYQKHFEVVANSKKVLDFAAGGDSSHSRREDNYTVICFWGNGDSTVTECGDDVGCAGAATWACIQDGGCAKVCNGRISYVPKTILAEVTVGVSAIEPIVKQAMAIGEANDQAISFTIARHKEQYWLKEIHQIDSKSGRPATFQLDCYGGDGELLWQEWYNDTHSLSEGILYCTDLDGGCAEVCEYYARYFPPSK
ncbi:hypothetical protein ACFQ1M_08125 [Sungkyunkwania multivorans]|uniref:Lipoprotein n=1 Tax=Sungkyunkwania multivorans TaxID=1173618 RepID=A0ABW3D008_9FLAO